MKVIFLKDVPRVGKRHDIKEMNAGYAMNFLIPRSLAVVATPQAIKDLEFRQKEIIIEREVQDNLLVKNLKEIQDKTVTIKAKTDEKGHLFSAIHGKMIREALHKEFRIELDEKFIALEKQIKELGEFDIPILIKNKKASFKLLVEKEI